MQYIKVLAIDSTNTALKRLYRENPQMPTTCFWAKNQMQGRGQRQGSWHTEPNKNLTFSILFKNIALKPQEAFKLNALISTTLVTCLASKFNIPNLAVKWPNDILSGSKKICGILIETILKQQEIKHCVVGIGLNVNQTDYKNLPQAGSLKTITNRDFDLETLCHTLTEAFEQVLSKHLQIPVADAIATYEQILFRKHKVSSFQFPDGELKKGIITGISSTGLLCVSFENRIEEFDLKEVKLLY